MGIIRSVSGLRTQALSFQSLKFTEPGLSNEYPAKLEVHRTPMGADNVHASSTRMETLEATLKRFRPFYT